MDDPVNSILQYVAKLLLVGGSGAAVAYALFRYLGKSWIESKFAERLESLKHDQAIELQRLRVQIESMLSGTLKLQELEFKVLPEAWSKLDEAYALLRWVTASAQEFPKIVGLTDSELSEYLSKVHPEFLDSQVTRIIAAREGHERDAQYQEILLWQRLRLAKKTLSELETYIAGNGLLLPLQLKRQFLEIIPHLRGALISGEMAQQYKDRPQLREASADWAAAAPLHEAIEKTIEERLHSHASQ
jgi:hypothetical protein